MFAEIDATGWAVIIGAGFVGVTGTITGILTLIFGFVERRRAIAREDTREAAKIERERIQAEKVQEVANRVVTATREVANVKAAAVIVAAKAETAAALVEQVAVKLETHTVAAELKLDSVIHATNGMKAELEKAAFARGVKSETDKQDKGELPPHPSN
jgi:uncharacterized transporter YbjL